jgi:hypothetical protein
VLFRILLEEVGDLEPWSIGRYQRPYLAVERVALENSLITMQRDGERYQVSITGEAPSQAKIVQVLRELRSPDCRVWRAAKASPDHVWFSMLSQLDTLGLIEDAERGLASIRRREATRIQRDVNLVACWLGQAAAVLPKGKRSRMGRRLLKRGIDLLQGHNVLREAQYTDNFYDDILERMFSNWERSAPVSLAAAVLALQRFLDGIGDAEHLDGSALAARLIENESAGLFEPMDVRMHLQAMCVLLTLSATSDNQRRSKLPNLPLSLRSGINFALDAERQAASTLEQLGESSFYRVIMQGKITRELAAGVYLEQYHLSARFVEITTPLMRRRLRKSLRELVFRYYSEEVGHEIFEKGAALSVGVSEDEIESSLPMPLFTAYLEVLTDLADVSPIGLLISVLVTEGFPGTHTPINRAFQAAGLGSQNDAVRKHEEVNLDLHHSTIPRLLLSEIPVVTPVVQQKALADLVTILELNYRAWHMLNRYYGASDLAFPHSWMSIPPHRVVELFSLNSQPMKPTSSAHRASSRR